MSRSIRRRTVRAAALCVLSTLACAAPAPAAVVKHGYLPLRDGTRLNYTLTLPSATGRHPVILQYDPYNAGSTSDTWWSDHGYAMLGVNFRGTACSEGTFQPLRADRWGPDGADVVAWAAAQPWSDGGVGMIGYSFTGVSQLATAAYAGPALKAIAPGNVFPDLYRDMIYPGGIHNGWIPLWIAARDYALAAQSTGQAVGDLHCAANVVSHLLPNLLQTLDTQNHPYLDDFWSRQPETVLDRIRVPVLGCVNWQDTTVYSRAFDAFRRLPPATTWVMGGNGTHADCPIGLTRLLRFFDRYVAGRADPWRGEPHLLLTHEVTGKIGQRRKAADAPGGWTTGFSSWRAMDDAVTPLALHLRAGGRLELAAPTTDETPDAYRYPTPTANTSSDFLTLDHWGEPPVPAGTVAYTTPRLSRDAELLGSGSADLWVSSTATDSDLQLTLTEVRPDGQESYVQNGWLRLSHRALDRVASTALRPVHTDLDRDATPVVPGRPVLARVQLLPFDHVFRAGSAIRLSIDAPGGYFQIVPTPATNTIHHAPGADSRLLVGWLPDARAQAPLPACGTVLNQPCRRDLRGIPAGVLELPPSVVLAVGRAPSLRGARAGDAFALAVQARGGPVGGARVTLRDAHDRLVATSRRFSLGTRRMRVRVVVRRAVRPGRLTLALTGRTADGRRVTVSRAVRVSRPG